MRRLIQAIPSFLKAQPDAATPIQGQEEIHRQYRYWRIRILYSLFIGYAVFYFLRKNLSAATPDLLSDLNLTKTQVGLLWSALYLSYGIGKFINGILGDRANPRYFMAIGLLLSAIANILFGLSSAFTILLIFWGLNGWFQAMGWPPCARGLTQWFSQRERGTYWGIWNASHQIGGAVILVFAGWLTAHYGWRSSFFIPSLIAILIAMALINRLRDTPGSLGLPSVTVYKTDPETEAQTKSEQLSTRDLVWKVVLGNKWIWFLAIGNFFVYIVRYGTMDWAPTFLVETKGHSLVHAAIQVAGFELTGIVGSFAAGYLSDKLFKGRRGPVNLIYMILLAFGILVFWLNPPGNPWIDAIALGSMGFLVYGPQMLVGVSAADIVGRGAAATATGFTGLTGYLGSIVSGVGVGFMVDQFGWYGGFSFILLCALLGALCFTPGGTNQIRVLISKYKKVQGR